MSKSPTTTKAGIRREDVESGRIDFADVATGRKLPAVHPGEILGEEFLKPLGLSQYKLSKETKIPVARINQIVRRKRAVSPETALRLARYFGTSAAFWLALQSQYDVEVAQRKYGKVITREVQPRAA